MVWILIRHDPKEYANNKGLPKFDPAIIENVNEINVNDLILTEFKPDIIITSPFLRCRQTCTRYYENITPIIDPLFSEYLGNWKDHNVEHFDEKTWEYIHDFSFESNIVDFRKRLSMLKLDKTKNILIVTHGFALTILNSILKSKGLNVTEFCKDPKLGFKIDKFL